MATITLNSNAWCGQAASGALADDGLGWAVQGELPRPAQGLAPEVLDLDDWRHDKVGWGVVLPERTVEPPAAKAAGADAPAPIRELIAARGNAPVLRWAPGLKEGRLRRYAPDGSFSEPSLRGPRGMAANAVPRYLLIVASPAEIPWHAQYRLQTDAFVGRLDLDEPGLARYVKALREEWQGGARNVHRPLLWCVDHGHPDITRLMRKTIAEKLRDAFAADGEFAAGAGFLSDAQATHAQLMAALGAQQPAFVATSSHGATFPLDNPTVMRSQMGALVDVAHTIGQPDLIAKAWNPRGAIWYAHACCSAGADATSRFEGLVQAQSSLGQTLEAIAHAGACTAPLPRALLGGENPLGAFIGHVEPTFDWTLRDPLTGQATSQHVVDALYATLHLASRPTIGRAMSAYFSGVAGLLQDHADALDAVDQQEQGALERARRTRLIATDRLAMVILGDPTVRLPVS